MKYSMAGLLLALPLGALAAEPIAQAAAAPAVGSVGGQLTQLMLGLLLVVGLIFVLAWLMRRVQRIGPGNAQVIELIGSRALGPRDRLVLVQVGEEQILLGLTPGRITPLHVLKTPVDAAKTEAATPEFAQRLMELLGKDQKDKK
ncbi:MULTISPECIES: flagellar biosynthetic protein FliO [unclassified Pseudomonas]|uniref:flagellar biosynthetic protein FliO n=1 Tax=unclassified Pseudomonas TaxID=196821 RepID=UPI000F5680CB|nr:MULTISPECIES: flagellar biosynthetic protein FliO [unclassified Pseudomonas]AZF11874.1 Flagellar biosynthesis protein FliO [Pseudomonas sp. R2-37-08W]AZF17150.1 Flagellar biosynthesis protein FliO [Pseudomonas sp. R3-18-08]AZF27838.1 Flagellar biosynthesis protein FliO [Pseudomonas sp. R2-60-08W]AZF33157.1 Flagellar biosynthesis protein FliO [Pseudomonas sp. R4-35-07]AZF38548.1 Flagellar biosynthesis protein FliO [Pseudomonas sp. R4-39-08]